MSGIDPSIVVHDIKTYPGVKIFDRNSAWSILRRP
jgi:hypothetical protein